jgi:retinol-binding protein 3
MLHRSALFLLLCGAAWSQPVVIPDTPAGQALQAWLDAFNSGDRARIQAYLAKYEPVKALDPTMAFRQQTGGFDLLGIDKSGRLETEFRVKERASSTTAVGKIEVKDAVPPTVVSFGLRAIPPGLTAADMDLKIDAATRARVIDGAIAMLNEYYVYPDSAKKMEEALRAKQRSGEYEKVDEAQAFAAMLTTELQEVSHDKHLRVDFVPRALPKGDLPLKPIPEQQAQMRAQMERNNCAFEQVEWHPSNIGYLKFNGFASPAICGPTAVAAMNFLGNVDALIIDLRDNGGGDPEMIAFLATYLFDEPTHLNDLYNRKENSTTQYWTLPYVPGKKLAGKPVFVLTSKRTFSGAEEFSYDYVLVGYLVG